MTQTFVVPEYKKQAFNCPYCGAYAHQTWIPVMLRAPIGHNQHPLLELTVCSHCDKEVVWYMERMIEPGTGSAPLPNLDLPEDIKGDYFEARDIMTKSPRGAAALLRLCIQKLCIHLGEKGNKINEDIKNLVKKGLPVQVQQSLDYVRIVGNEAVHPGQLDLKDNIETVSTLFKLINVITEFMITQPKLIESLYTSLPADKLDQIERRDNQVKR